MLPIYTDPIPAEDRSAKRAGYFYFLSTARIDLAGYFEKSNELNSNQGRDIFPL